MQEKKVTKVGWLPVEEKISKTWSESEFGDLVKDLDIVLPKEQAEFYSKTGEARKVKVTLSLTVEDV